MYDVTKIIPQEQFDELVRRLPTPKHKSTGRPRCKKEALARGILQVLVNGVAWKKIADCGCSPSSCHRYFQELQRRGILKETFDGLEKSKTDTSEIAIDTSTATSFRFKRGAGWDGKHKKIGTKISLITDKNGLPADVEFDKGSKHDLTFVSKHIENTAGRRKKTANLDKGYTSLELRRELRDSGTKVNMEMRKGDYIRKRGPKFRFDKEKYKVRFFCEKCFAWLKAFKRVRMRMEYKLANYKAFVYLALIIILLRN